MSGEDKTEAPSPKRKKDARREGRIPRSPEIAAWAGLLAATVAIKSTVGRAGHTMTDLMHQVGIAMASPDQQVAMRLFGSALGQGVLAIAPLVGVLMATGLVANIAQTGFAPTTHSLKPKFSHINPGPALKRLVGPQSAWETAKQLAKVALLAGLGWRTIHRLVEEIVGRGHLATMAVAGRTAAVAVDFARDAALLGLVLAALDWAMARRRIMKTLKMTKHEVKEEAKAAEGNAEVKGQIRARQRAIARVRMLEAVPAADAVLVNPTHVAVAIAYQPGSRAPKVVARGAGASAAKIRELAVEHGVPVVRDVPLTRTLYKACNIGDEVPPLLFDAVARVLAFVYGLRRDGRRVRLDGTPHELPPALRTDLSTVGLPPALLAASKVPPAA